MSGTFRSFLKGRQQRQWRDRILIKVDVLGLQPFSNPKLHGIMREIKGRIGWNEIKAKIDQLAKISDENYGRELEGVAPHPVVLHRLFLGNPGTGKSTCATYSGRVLKALGFLSNGGVMLKKASDFTGSHEGDTEKKRTSSSKWHKEKSWSSTRLTA